MRVAITSPFQGVGGAPMSQDGGPPVRHSAGRVAVVTGGASGMGLAVARRLAAAGDRVGILDLNGDAAQQVANELRDEGHSAVGVQVDVSNRQAVEDALQKVRSEF